jgi:hypothetical protein
MSVKFSLSGPGIQMVETFPDWHAFDLSRADQWHRSTLAGRVNRLADGVADSGTYSDRPERWERARAIRQIADRIQNGGGLGGSCGDLHWRLEIDKPDTGEAAA